MLLGSVVEGFRDAHEAVTNARVDDVVEILTRIAFEDNEDIVRRESALVLLRGRLAAWNPSGNPALKTTIESKLGECVTRFANSDSLLLYRTASIVSALLSRKSQSSPSQGNDGDDWAELRRSVSSTFASLQNNNVAVTSELFTGMLMVCEAVHTDHGALDCAPTLMFDILGRALRDSPTRQLTLPFKAFNAYLQYLILQASAAAETGDRQQGAAISEIIAPAFDSALTIFMSRLFNNPLNRFTSGETTSDGGETAADGVPRLGSPGEGGRDVKESGGAAGGVNRQGLAAEVMEGFSTTATLAADKKVVFTTSKSIELLKPTLLEGGENGVGQDGAYSSRYGILAMSVCKAVALTDAASEETFLALILSHMLSKPTQRTRRGRGATRGGDWEAAYSTYLAAWELDLSVSSSSDVQVGDDDLYLSFEADLMAWTELSDLFTAVAGNDTANEKMLKLGEENLCPDNSSKLDNEARACSRWVDRVKSCIEAILVYVTQDGAPADSKNPILSLIYGADKRKALTALWGLLGLLFNGLVADGDYSLPRPALVEVADPAFLTRLMPLWLQSISTSAASLNEAGNAQADTDLPLERAHSEALLRWMAFFFMSLAVRLYSETLSRQHRAELLAVLMQAVQKERTARVHHEAIVALTYVVGLEPEADFSEDAEDDDGDGDEDDDEEDEGENEGEEGEGADKQRKSTKQSREENFSALCEWVLRTWQAMSPQSNRLLVLDLCGPLNGERAYIQSCFEEGQIAQAESLLREAYVGLVSLLPNVIPKENAAALLPLFLDTALPQLSLTGTHAACSEGLMETIAKCIEHLSNLRTSTLRSLSSNSENTHPADTLTHTLRDTLSRTLLKVQEASTAALQFVLAVDRERNAAATHASFSSGDGQLDSRLNNSSTENTLTLAAARIINSLPEELFPQLLPLIREIVANVRDRLMDDTGFSFTSKVRERQLGPAGYELTATEDNATLTIAQNDGTDLDVNLNTSVLESQMTAATFFSLISSNLGVILPRTCSSFSHAPATGANPSQGADPSKSRSLSLSLEQLSSDFEKIAVMHFIADIRQSALAVLQTLILVAFANVDSDPSPTELALYLRGFLRLLRVGTEMIQKTVRASKVHPVLYVLADACDPLRALAGRQSARISPALLLQLPAELGIEGAEIEGGIFAVAAAAQPHMDSPHMDGSDEVTQSKLPGSAQEGDEKVLVVDAVMQFMSRAFRGFDRVFTDRAFEELKARFGLYLFDPFGGNTVCRVGALVFYAAAIENRGGEDGQQFLDVALLYSAPHPDSLNEASTRASTLLGSALPGTSISPEAIRERLRFPILRDLAASQEGELEKEEDDDSSVLITSIATAVATALQFTGSSLSEISTELQSVVEETSEVLSTSLEEGALKAETMRLQAAVYAIGMVAISSQNFVQEFLPKLPKISNVFQKLIEHPLAALASRRVILDGLACAIVKISLQLAAVPQSVDSGLESLLAGTIFAPDRMDTLLEIVCATIPLKEDAEDAQYVHDVLIAVALAQAKTHFSSDLRFRPHLTYVLRWLASDPEANESLLSPKAKAGQLYEACRALGVSL